MIVYILSSVVESINVVFQQLNLFLVKLVLSLKILVLNLDICQLLIQLTNSFFKHLNMLIFIVYVLLLRGDFLTVRE